MVRENTDWEEIGACKKSPWQGTELMENPGLKKELSTKDELSSRQDRLSRRGGKPGGLATMDRNWGWAISLFCDGQKKALFSLSH